MSRRDINYLQATPNIRHNMTTVETWQIGTHTCRIETWHMALFMTTEETWGRKREEMILPEVTRINDLKDNVSLGKKKKKKKGGKGLYFNPTSKGNQTLQYVYTPVYVYGYMEVWKCKK
jgi:hypothetical protein